MISVPPRLTSFVRSIVPAVVILALTLGLRAQEHVHTTTAEPVPLQPLAQQVRRLETALAYLGQPLPAADRNDHQRGRSRRATQAAAVSRLQEVLDRHVLATVHINPESRVKVGAGRRQAGACGGRYAAVPRESCQRSGRDGAAHGAEPEQRPRLHPVAMASRAADGAHRGQVRRTLGGHFSLHRSRRCDRGSRVSASST